MPKGYLLLIVVAAILVAEANSQEIVIEPTNGRAPTANRQSRPAELEAVPTKTKATATSSASQPAKQSANQERSAAGNPAKKVPVKKVAPKLETAPVETRPSPPATLETAKNESAALAPPPKSVSERLPAWAMTDTRDARSLQNEIASALARDPRLAGSTIRVSVDDASVTLEGSAAGDEEHRQAQRLARSYAWNRKLVDHIAVMRKSSAQK